MNYLWADLLNIFLEDLFHMEVDEGSQPLGLTSEPFADSRNIQAIVDFSDELVPRSFNGI
jgi:hypothetical protein